jgi:CRP/FNR family transcriptional regulator/CRP/FNR family cyclic AMP-dependent transcriptional regulator
MRGLAGMVRRLSGQVQDVIALDATGRIAKKLLELAAGHGESVTDGLRIPLRITQEELAQMVGVTRALINKQLGWFQERGILSTDRGVITLHKPEELRKRIY